MDANVVRICFKNYLRVKFNILPNKKNLYGIGSIFLDTQR